MEERVPERMLPGKPGDKARALQSGSGKEGQPMILILVEAVLALLGGFTVVIRVPRKRKR
jgi:hypothetical protein